MSKPFNELRERLLRAGVAPRHVRRYLKELADHLVDLREEERLAGRSPADAESAALARLGAIDDLAGAMIDKTRFQSWCARAPWAIFGVAPLAVLAATYLFACIILWSGWKFFLPGASTPFVPVDGLAILYFGVGRLLYFGAPVFVGWGIGVIAARQRFKTFWPAIGMLLIAWSAAAAHVQVTGPDLSSRAGHVGLGFSPLPSPQNPFLGLNHAAMVFLLAVLPYLIWRWREARSALE